MIKRNLSTIVIIIALLINVLSFDFSSFNIQSKKTWLLIGNSIIIIVAIIFIFVREHIDDKNADF